MLESFQQTVKDIKAKKDKGKKQASSDKPQMVGSSGYQTPDKKK